MAVEEWMHLAFMCVCTTCTLQGKATCDCCDLPTEAPIAAKAGELFFVPCTRKGAKLKKDQEYVSSS